jgi:hypothetical protein
MNSPLVKGRYFRADFDRSQEFYVARGFTFNGAGFQPGQVIDKSQFSVRRLRQLYDLRKINQRPPVVNGQSYPPQEPSLEESYDVSLGTTQETVMPEPQETSPPPQEGRKVTRRRRGVHA